MASLSLYEIQMKGDVDNFFSLNSNFVYLFFDIQKLYLFNVYDLMSLEIGIHS